MINEKILQILRKSGENYDLARLELILNYDKMEIINYVEDLIQKDLVKVTRTKDSVFIMRNLSGSFY